VCLVVVFQSVVGLVTHSCHETLLPLPFRIAGVASPLARLSQSPGQTARAAADQDAGPSSALRRVFALVQDNDLWLHQLSDSRAFACGLNALSLNYDFSKDQELFHRLVCGIDVDEVIKAGQTRLAHEDVLIEKELEGSFGIDVPVWGEGVSLHDVSIHAVKTDHPGLRSEMGNRLAARSPSAVAAVVYTGAGVPKGKVKVSLRSVGEVDTTKVSLVYGGGGHRNASSFLISSAVFESWRSS
jgi:oligoribonuclease NrnB/cAMP/cGMP phosphodiesterase (DHH superfamily)